MYTSHDLSVCNVVKCLQYMAVLPAPFLLVWLLLHLMCRREYITFRNFIVESFTIYFTPSSSVAADTAECGGSQFQDG